MQENKTKKATYSRYQKSDKNEVKKINFENDLHNADNKL